MSHEITQRADGFAEMAYVGAAPWHGLGQALQPGLSIDQWRQAAGMDWRICRSRVRYVHGQEQHIVDDHHVLFRSDTKSPLAVVSKQYKVVQPNEVLEFFRDLTEANGFTLETAGTLFDGRKFWALASIGESACIIGDDKVDGYLLLSSSCDGSMATNARFTTVRVVCANTLGMALNHKAAREITVSHRSVFDASLAKRQLGIATDSFGSFIKASRVLASKSVSVPTAELFVESLLRDSKSCTKDDVQSSTGFRSIMNLFGHGKGNEGASAWDLVNGVTEYVDHVQRSQSASNRLASSMMGRGDAMKTEAFERALAL